MTGSSYSLNCGGRLLELNTPQVMGILNVTPDSFFAGSRAQTEADIARRCRQVAAEGAAIIDVGAYSSRPGATDVSPDEEMARLRLALPVVRREAPGLIVSADTFRADVARMCVEEYGAEIINDISGGSLDARMFRTVARLGVPYVLMHMAGTPQTMQDAPHYDDVVAEVLLYFARRIQTLHELGVADIVIDPGFGFAKTLFHNYALLNRLEDFRELGLPLLAGVSRKSMVYKLLGGTPETALNGTTVLNALALSKGADILRVHDVRAAVETVRLHTAACRPETLQTGLQ